MGSKKGYGCVEHSKTFKSYAGWRYHKRTQHRDADVTPERPEQPETSPEIGTIVEEAFYPPLQDWERSREVTEAPTQQGPPPFAQAPQPVPAAIDTSGLWKSLGRLLDDSILKDAKVKTDVTDEKARVLDEALKQAGLYVVPPEKPIIIPAWAPLGIMLLGTFGLPVIAAYMPNFLKKLDDMAAPKKPEDDRTTGTETFAAERGGPR